MTDEYTGKAIDRVDGRAKVTGTAFYTADVPVANLAHAVIVGSTISKGRVSAIETVRAEGVPGVLAVLTPFNAPRAPGASGRQAEFRVVQALQDAEVWYDGQPIALVVADTLEHAHHAAALLSVRYERNEPRFEIEPEKDRAYTPKPSGNRPPPDSHRGDVPAGLASATHVIDETYTTPIMNHHPMEPHATIAIWSPDERLTVYDTTQFVFGVQRRLANVFGIPPDRVRVLSHFLGGGFGCKGSPWSHVILAAIAARAVRRPVKLVLTRQQMFAFVGYRPRTIQKVAIGAKADGKLTGIRHEVLSNTSQFDDFMEPAAYGTRMLYECENVQTAHRLVRLDVSTPTFTRAPGEASGSFALESAVDELAWKLGIDPLELRIKNYAERDRQEDKPWSSKSLDRCYELGAEKFGWNRRARATRASRDGDWLVGYGVASATYPARQIPASALARLRADGSVVVQTASHDLGTGTYTVMSQIAADALGVPIESVRFELGDTDMPEAPMSAGSMTASSVGSAVKRVGLALKDRMIALAVRDERSPLFGVAPADVVANAGRLFAKHDESRGETHVAILSRSGERVIEQRIDEKPSGERKKYSIHSFGAHFVEVRVDEALGMVRVSRVVSAFGAGKILNAKTGRSQFIGGIVWGIGLALEEATYRDPRDGRLVTKDLVDYHLPVNADVPAIEIVTVDEDDAWVNAVGAKGIGEVGTAGMGAAIANAVYHATGKRIRDLPITVEKVIG